MRTHVATVLMCIAFGGPTFHANAQVAEKPKLKVFALKHITPQWTAETLRDFFEDELSDTNIRVAQSGKELIISASADRMATIEALIATYDKAPRDPAINQPSGTQFRNAYFGNEPRLPSAWYQNTAYAAAVHPLKVLSQELQSATDKDEKELIVKAIEEAVESAFDKRQDRQQEQVDQLQQRLQLINARMQSYAKRRDEIIARAVGDISSDDGTRRNKAINSIIGKRGKQAGLSPLSTNTDPRSGSRSSFPNPSTTSTYLRTQNLVPAQEQFVVPKSDLVAAIKMRKIDVLEAQIKYEAARTELRRVEKLSEKGIVTTSELNATTTKMKLANVDYERSKLQLEEATTRLERANQSDN